MIVDQAEREEALDPSRSFIVQAPAGSGKTELLVQRYLRLLSLVDRPESVVAMTFTRKAAGELKERIYNALVAAHNDQHPCDDREKRTRTLALAALEQDRRLNWNLLLDPSRLQLQTIDSLCAMLTRQAPLESGFGGAPQTIENAEHLYRLAARSTLAALAEGAAEERDLLARLGLYFDSDFVCLQEQIVRMLGQRDQWRAAGDNCRADVADFCALLARADQVLNRVFAEHHAVDFIAITEAAIAVLGSPEQPSDVLYGLDYRIAHLLVDEFQDTSVAQYRLINALTAQWSEGDGHTLFLVGDPMQSIYRFRGAEVSLFLDTWRDRQLESVRLHRLTLRTNFRSTPEILDWVNGQFAPIMTNDTGGVQFCPSEAARMKGGAEPSVTPFLADDTPDEAQAVGEIARQAQKKGSVAILVRNRSHLARILPVLRNTQRLDYEAVEIDPLNEQQHVVDLISLTRAILHIADRTAWLACLRAPWCGLSLRDLAALGEGERRLIIDLLADPARLALLTPEGRSRAVRTGEVLSAAAGSAGRMPLRNLVEGSWLSLGGPAVLDRPHQAEDVDAYLDLIEDLDDGGAIRDFAVLNERLTFLFAKPSQGENHIQVMTVFKAKGLEFDTVILPHLEGGAKESDRDLLVWNEEIAEDGSVNLEVAAQPPRGKKDEMYDSIRRKQRIAEEQELKRLLYVACTRAKNDLYLLGAVKRNRQGGLQGPRGGTFLKLIWPAVQDDFERLLRRAPKQGDLFGAEEDVAQIARTVLRRLPADWQLPRFSRPVRWQPQFHTATASARKVTYEWVSDTGRYVGVVVHELLRRASNLDIEHSRATVSKELLRLGVPKTEEPAATERVFRAVQNTLASDRGRWILSPHAETRSEWPIDGILGDRLISGTVDRMFRDEHGRLWIIDFKTSEHQGSRLQEFLDEEQRRYSAQLESYAALLSRMFAGPIWLGLYFPLLDAWREWQFEGAAALIAR